MVEYVDIYDVHNKPTGKKVARPNRYKEEYYCRGVHIWIYNTKKELLIHKIAKTKKFAAGKWDLYIGGHVSSGELEKNTALRELAEELGIYAKNQQLKLVKVAKLREEERGLVSNEFAYAYVFKYMGEMKNIKFDKSEIEELKFISLEALAVDMIKQPSKYAPNGKYGEDMLYRMKKITRS
jgi:isopentenyldiphosphate isomerase